MPSARHLSRKGTISKPRVLDHLLCLVQLWILFRPPSKTVHSFTLKWFCVKFYAKFMLHSSYWFCLCQMLNILTLLLWGNHFQNYWHWQQRWARTITSVIWMRTYRVSLLADVGWKVQGQWICFCMFLEV